jgi:WD40 repeat protein
MNLFVLGPEPGASLRISSGTKYPFYYGSADLSSDGRLVVAKAIDAPAAYLWDSTSGERVRSLQKPRLFFATKGARDQPEANDTSFETHRLGFTPPGRHAWGILEGSVAEGDGKRDPARPEKAQRVKVLALWNAATGKPARSFPLHDDQYVNDVCWSADGRLVLIVNDRVATLWDVERGALVHRLAVPSLYTRGMADLSPDGRWIAVYGQGGGIQFWDVATGAEAVRLFGAADPAQWLAVTPDGRFDGTEALRRLVAFRAAGSLDLLPPERAVQDFYRPGLLTQLWGDSSRATPR